MATTTMTIEKTLAFARDFVKAEFQAGDFESAKNFFTNLTKKIGLQITIVGGFADKLPELDGNELPLGKTIEEYFIRMGMPFVKGSEDAITSPFGAKKLEFADAAYSYDLGTIVHSVNFPYNEVEEAMISEGSLSNLVGRYFEAFNDQETNTRYYLKKQLLHNVITKAVAADTANSTHLVQEIAKPVDETTGENFIIKIKDLVEDASFANEGNCLANEYIGATPTLKLYIKKGILSNLQVKTLAGAFQEGNLAMPCEIKVLDDFGYDGTPDSEGYVDTSKVYAMLIDPRAVKLCRTYVTSMEQPNAAKNEINYFRHIRYTGFISKFAYMKVLKDVA